VVFTTVVYSAFTISLSYDVAGKLTSFVASETVTCTVAGVNFLFPGTTNAVGTLNQMLQGRRYRLKAINLHGQTLGQIVQVIPELNFGDITNLHHIPSAMVGNNETVALEVDDTVRAMGKQYPAAWVYFYTPAQLTSSEVIYTSISVEVVE